MKRKALLILPEAPYPVVGGGALRTASIVDGLKEEFELTAIHYRLEGEEDPAVRYPAGVLSGGGTIDLPHHAKSFLPRAVRNLKRTVMGVPPLIDRFGGQAASLEKQLEGAWFDLVWVEHFWLAPYARLLRRHGGKLVMDLHNVESSYYESLAAASPWWQRPLLRRFASQALKYEAKWLPEFDVVVTTSAADAQRVTHGCKHVLPNTIPFCDLPAEPKSESIVFTGNFAFTPNQQALEWFFAEVWPEVLRQRPSLRLRLVGKEIQYAPQGVCGVDYVGPVEDAVREIAKSWVAIVPLRSGSGTRLKILEAFAAGTAVVSTTIGAEGLEANGAIAIANGADSFGQAILNLIDNEVESSRLAHAARHLYEARYTWGAARQILRELQL
ncbi:MAG: glycosyltransferase [Acidobacteria bacterium]|nr:glycosyltransferase [Acidobacteriota bacterium]